MFPFFGALRQLLEHRDEEASVDVNYCVTDHGAATRIFGDGLFAGLAVSRSATFEDLSQVDPLPRTTSRFLSVHPRGTFLVGFCAKLATPCWARPCV